MLAALASPCRIKQSHRRRRRIVSGRRHYNYFRDYDPSTGRYIESDPIGLNGGISTFGYAGGNPIAYADPLGLATDCQVQIALKTLMNEFPENYPKGPNGVYGKAHLTGTFGNEIAAVTGYTNSITYNADLYAAPGVPVKGDAVDDFYQTMAHEMFHVNATLSERLMTTPTIEDMVDHNADVVYHQSIKDYKKALDKCGCQK